LLSLSEYTELDGLDLADLIKRREVSREEVTATALQAIDAVNGELNAVIGRIDPPAYNNDAPDDAVFAGVPYLLKDVAHGWKGIRCDLGSRFTEGYIASADSTFAKRSKLAGLVALGRTNTPEFGMHATTESSLHGATRNPWDINRTPGGSSGGAAAAVASGMVPIAHASDGGGSIRLPAAWCGLVGLKPSRGLNPRHDGSEWGIAEHIVSRSVRDTAAMLDATAGPDSGAYVRLDARESYVDDVGREPGKLRIALSTRFKDAPNTDAVCMASAIEAARLLESFGHEIVEATPDISFPETSILMRNLFLATVVPNMELISADIGCEISADLLEPAAWSSWQHGQNVSAADLYGYLNEMWRMTYLMDEFLNDYDLLLTPAVSSLPVGVGEYDPMRYEVGSLDFWSTEGSWYSFLPLASITGQPSLILPVQGSDCALPTGIQLFGRQGAEPVLFRLAGQLEQECRWQDRRPPIHASMHAS
jgi:Asp-tRNA(Asn)/Glu-tRNA(Gln) amidotransferase A subunit family amidase